VELTRVGPGAQSADFATAVQLGLAHFRTSGHELQGVIDVYLAHRSGIRPLPSSTCSRRTARRPPSPARRGGLDRAAGRRGPDPNAAAGRGGGCRAAYQRTIHRRGFQQWKKALLDLSLRNPLLNLPKRGKGLELHVPVGALALLDDLIHDGKQVEVVPQDAISHVHELAGARRAQDLDPEMLTRSCAPTAASTPPLPKCGTRRDAGLQRDARNHASRRPAATTCT